MNSEDYNTKMEYVTGYILATKCSETTEIRDKIEDESHKTMQNTIETSRYYNPKDREGGRTVGSGRVATVIE